MDNGPLITNDAVNLGILMAILAFVFVTSHSERPGWKRFYSVIPSLFVCYFLPSILTTLGVYDPDQSQLYFVASRYLLPASLVLLTLSIDIPGIIRLGPKAGVMFLTGTVGIIIGGPLAILIVSMINPDIVGGAGPEAVWRGMTTIAGSWIGGGANQTAMKEVFDVGDDLFSIFIAVDVIVANIWMAVLLYGVGRADKIDKFLKADTSAIEDIKKRVEEYQAQIMRIPTLTDTMKVLGVGFGVMGLSHFLADIIAPWLLTNAPRLADYQLTSPFFWLVVISTTAGLILSGTKARQLEGVGASRIGSALLYVLVATIGMRMNLAAIGEEPELFGVALIWIGFHALLLIIVAKLIKAPFFFLAVGSQANVGGAASAPIVASAFHPSLATVGVLLAVLGYALGTYGALLCGQLMRMAAP
jgi:uncharacterized membrane protein